ncbi:MAG: diphthine--ammonia ligase [Candidatus Bathyarchaeia archaeon]
MIVAASWSGGKDSCLACHKAMQEGHVVACLVNFISQQHRRVSFHGVPADLILEQARSVEIPLLQRETSGGDYEEQFRHAVKSLVERGIEGMVFGDVYLQEHRDWVERMCSNVGLKVLEPLWGMDARDVYSRFINLGFDAIVVSAKSDLIGKEWVGRHLDRRFLGFLERSGIDVCGENGEYHTFVIDGPIFKRRISILDKEVVLREKNWYADLQRYATELK